MHCRAFLFVIVSCFVLTFLTLQGCGTGPQTCDYVLSAYEDIIFPPSGSPQAWVTIIGGDREGTFYVSPDGTDTNPGTRQQPFKTLAHAVSNLQPGDTLVVLAREPGGKPIIGGRNNLICAFDISNCRYVRIENLEITSCNRAWFREAINGTAGPVEHVLLKDLTIHHVDEFGIDIGDADDIQMLGCSITYCGFGCIGGPPGEHGGLRNMVIKNCDLSYSGHYYQGGDGTLRPYDRPDGFGIEASEGPVEIAATTVCHNYGDGLDSKAKRTFIHECLVANNSCDGIKLWGDDSRVENCLVYGRGDGDDTTTPWSPFVISTEQPGSRFSIVNCTVDDQIGNNYMMHVQYDFQEVPVQLAIVNSIFASRGTNAPVIWLGRAVSYDIRSNLFYAPQDDRILIIGDDQTFSSAQVGALGSGNISGDPLFVATGWGNDGDYHVRSGSPALDAGDEGEAPATSLDGTARPQGGGVDIGCYEQ
ncbi:MAG: hypothetical protein N3B18_11700 [Desulfobacterota bacterium]|nr:hypothetical protein [Thermodesulfobacteriota bacterium]